MSPVSKSKAVKARKTGQTRQELNLEGRERKRQKKHRGHQPGARNRASATATASGQGKGRAERDPRIGSKTPVALVADTPTTQKQQPRAQTSVQPDVNMCSAEDMLARLENDPRLDTLLERLEKGETLNGEEQCYVDEMLDRIDALMEELGIELEDDEDEVPEQEDIMQLLRRGSPKDAL